MLWQQCCQSFNSIFKLSMTQCRNWDDKKPKDEYEIENVLCLMLSIPSKHVALYWNGQNGYFEGEMVSSCIFKYVSQDSQLVSYLE